MRHFSENWDGIVRRNNGIMSFRERNRFVQTMESAAWIDESIHFTTEEILIFEEGNFEKFVKMPIKKIIEGVKRAATWMSTNIDRLSGVLKILVQTCRDYASGMIDFGKFKSILVSKCNISSSGLDYLKPKFEKVVAMRRLQAEGKRWKKRWDDSNIGAVALSTMGMIGAGMAAYFMKAANAASQAAQQATQKIPELLARPEVAQAVDQMTQTGSSSTKQILVVVVSLAFIALLGLYIGMALFGPVGR